MSMNTLNLFQSNNFIGLSSCEFQVSTIDELVRQEPVGVIYTYNTVEKSLRVTKEIFSYICFPITIYNLLHSLLGKLILLPSSTACFFSWLSSDSLSQMRSHIPAALKEPIRRVSIEVDGYLIDALIIKNEQQLAKNRWMIFSLGNMQTYEDTCLSGITTQMLHHFESHGIVFNYPGVGESTGLPSKEAMIKAYKGILNFVEDKEKGLGAKEIIGYGFSIGGGVQGEALKEHCLKEDIKYVFIKDRTFSSIADTATSLLSIIAGLFIKILGWDISSKESSRRLKTNEIIIQTSSSNHPFAAIVKKNQPPVVFASNRFCKLTATDVANDGIIPQKTSLAHYLLNQSLSECEEKVFLGVRSYHNDPIDISDLAKCTKLMLN